MCTLRSLNMDVYSTKKTTVFKYCASQFMNITTNYHKNFKLDDINFFFFQIENISLRLDTLSMIKSKFEYRSLRPWLRCLHLFASKCHRCYRFAWVLIFLTINTFSQYVSQNFGGCHWSCGIFNSYFIWIKDVVTQVLLLSDVLCYFLTLTWLCSPDFYQSPWPALSLCF